jgi:hypothetical protein
LPGIYSNYPQTPNPKAESPDGHVAEIVAGMSLNDELGTSIRLTRGESDPESLEVIRKTEN